MAKYKPALLTVKDVKNFIYEAITEHPTEIYTQKELREALKISHYRLNKYIKQGLPYVKKNGKQIYRLSEVKTWLSKNGIESTETENWVGANFR